MTHDCLRAAAPVNETRCTVAPGVTSCTVFPGITLTFYDTFEQTAYVRADRVPDDGVVEINHCRDGRAEFEFNNEFCYLTPGDVSVTGAGMSRGAFFPLRRYQGVTVAIDVARAPECLSCVLDDVNVRPENLRRKFCASGSGYVARSNARIAHIFSELYAVPDDIKKGYFKVKILELLLFFSALEPEPDAIARRCIPRAQANLAKGVCAYLTAHMEERVTLQTLTDVFHMSGTSIKNAFKAVYGVSIYAYGRAQKMQAAALMLRSTDRSVLEVASRFGYDNGSKFAKAFRDCCGMSPNEFRQSSRNCPNGADFAIPN